MVRLPDDGVKVEANNRATLELDMEWAHANTPYKCLLQVVSDVLDSSISGSDSFVSIGTTRDKSAITMMVQLGGRRHNLYAPDLRTLDVEAAKLL